MEIRPSNGEIGPALDVRGDGSYVVGPPSLHYTGRRYDWEVAFHPDDLPLADLPEAWIRKLQKKEKARRIDPGGEKIPEGRRNDTLLSFAGYMRRKGGMSGGDEINPALQAINELRCDPPLEYKEVEKIAYGVERYDPAPTAGDRPAGGRCRERS